MITKKKIRKIYPPLNLTISTEVTSGSLSQLYDSTLDSFTPQRSLSAPLVIKPKVMARTGDTDKTWTDGEYTANLQEIQWYANNAKIQDVSALSGYYSVSSSSESNGTLTITKNITPAEHYDMVMKAKFHDSRTNTNIEVVTDAVTLCTTENAANEWDLSVVHDTAVRYYPLLDKLKEYDWKVANGKMSASETEKQKCYDGNQYDLTLPIIISCGNNVIDNSHAYWNKCQIKTFLFDEEGLAYEYGPATGSNASFIKSIEKTGVNVDLRLIPGGTVLEVALYVGSVKMASEFLTFTPVISSYTCDIMNEGDLDPNASTRKDKVICYVNGKKMEYPEAYLDIRWYTNSQSAEAVFHGSGECCDIDIEKAKVGSGNNCWLEVYVESYIKVLVACIAIDSDKNIYLVNENEEYITVDMLHSL